MAPGGLQLIVIANIESRKDSYVTWLLGSAMLNKKIKNKKSWTYHLDAHTYCTFHIDNSMVHKHDIFPIITVRIGSVGDVAYWMVNNTQAKHTQNVDKTQCKRGIMPNMFLTTMHRYTIKYYYECGYEFLILNIFICSNWHLGWFVTLMY